MREFTFTISISKRCGAADGPVPRGGRGWADVPVGARETPSMAQRNRNLNAECRRIYSTYDMDLRCGGTYRTPDGIRTDDAIVEIPG